MSRPAGPRAPGGVTLDELAGPDAAAALARLRAAAPVAWVAPLDGWLVTGHAPALAVLRDAAGFTVDDPRFSTAQVVGPSMLSLDGPAHARHRAPFAPPFRAARLAERFAGPVARLAADLVARVRPAGTAELRATVSGPLAVAVVADALGLDAADAPTVLRWYTAIVAAVTALSAGSRPDPAAAAATAELAAALRGARGGLLDGARATLTPDEVVSNAAVLMFGGIETVDGMIANALVAVLDRPAPAGAVRADPAVLPAVVEESLRLEPAAAVVDRYATRDVTLGGADIARGDLVRVSLAGANRDPAVFADPDTFDHTRTTLRAQLAFARGPHACLAMDLARLETVAALRALLTGLPGLRLAAPARAEGLVFRKPPAVHLAWSAP